MDAQRVERLSRMLAAAPNRRAMLGALGGALLLRSSPPVQAASEGWVPDERGINLCRLPGFPCGKDSQCCAGRCLADGTCDCRKSGRRAWIKAVCCSGRKKKGNKGKCR